MSGATTTDQMTPASTQMEAGLRKALTIATVLSIAFPYIQILPLASYTQPTALLLSALVLMITRFSGLRQMRWSDLATLAGFAIVGLTLFAITCYPYRDIQEYKYLLTYVSPLLIAGACFTLLKWDRRLFTDILAASIVVWFWIAMTQALLDPAFLTGLLGTWGAAVADISASGRGVIGLAPEPTHHAFHMLLLGGSMALLRRHRWTLILCAIDVLFLARSPSGTLVVGLMVATTLVIYLPRLTMLFCLVLAGVMAANIGQGLLDIAGGSRLLRLAGIALSDPLALFLEDYSTNIRVGGAIVGFWEAAQNLLFPQGLSFGDWSAERLLILDRYPFLQDISTVGIPSGYGVLLFQAGILVVPFIICSTRRLILAAEDRIALIAVLCVPLTLVFQYYLSAPQFAMAYGIAIYVYWSRRQA